MLLTGSLNFPGSSSQTDGSSIVKLDDSATYLIGEMSFYNCTELTELNIKTDSIQIDDKAFFLTNLEVVKYDGENDIICGSNVFPKKQKVSLSENFKSATFFGVDQRS